MNHIAQREQMMESIAIVGIGCRLPGGLAGPEQLWRTIRDGIDVLAGFSAPELRRCGASTGLRPGQLDQIDQFDPVFFGISPGEARSMDPQQRLLLEVSWEAMQDAGASFDREKTANVGVFVAISADDYRILCARDGKLDFARQVGTARGGAAGRISFAFNFSGPSLSIDSDRSSGLVAVQVACTALARGECQQAIVGAVNLALLDEVTEGFERAGLLAADGRCKFADARADGIVRTEAAVALMLKPVDAAVLAGDRIYAVVRGCATRHGGCTSDSYVAPSRHAHEEAIREALARAEVSARDISYVEAHGTGTVTGDPIELRAIGNVIGRDKADGSHCWVGSVKTNIGHSESAAGLVGLVKAALALAHGQIPASLHFEHPVVDLGALGLAVPTQVLPWPTPPGRRFAGVSSIGLTGTVAHVVLGEPPLLPAAVPAASPSVLILALSAHRGDVLDDLVQSWLTRLQTVVDEAEAAALCRAAARRTHHPERIAVIGRSAQELASALGRNFAGDLVSGSHGGRPSSARKVAFVFSGYGSQWLGMGRQLLTLSGFSEVVDQCDSILKRREGWTVREEVLALPERARFSDIAIVQPILVVFQIALAALLKTWGFEPEAVVGASMGEISAAYVAGALTLEDALEVICCRSRLLRSTRGIGRLVVVDCTLGEALDAITGHEDLVSIAGINSASSVLLGGEAQALARIVEPFERQGIFCRYVNIDASSHSPQVAAISNDLADSLVHITPQAERVAFHSTVSGCRTPGLALTADYWRRNLRQPVDLFGAIKSLLAEQFDTFVEISPHPMAVPSILDTLAEKGVDALALGTVRREEDEVCSLMQTVATLYARGHVGNWRALLGDGPVASDLPQYPLRRQAFWYRECAPAQVRSMNVSAAAEAKDFAPSVLVDANHGDQSIEGRSLSTARVASLGWRQRLCGMIARTLAMAPDQVATDRVFRELGLTSLALTELRSAIGTLSKKPLSAKTLFDYPTIDALSSWLENTAPTTSTISANLHAKQRPAPSNAIAVIGMACRFPGSSDLNTFWDLLQSGTDAVVEIPNSRWDVEALYSEDSSAPGKMYSRWAGLVEAVDTFDAAFFGIAPREAEAMDPQQRMLMELCWTALEHAGICPDRLAGTDTGVFVGMGTAGDYACLKGWTLDRSVIDAHDSTGNAAAIAAGRIAYFLGLHGPTMTVDTACSSSLVAVHLGVRSLRSRETSLAIVAGVNLIIAPEPTIAYCKTRMLSPRGRCRTFDVGADGYVRGEGCGVVVLKRLEDALRDGNAIHGIIRGTAINQDGRSNGLTAPSGRAQERLIEQALADAGVAPDSVGYLEAHGTGTPLGDPIELGAACAVLGRRPPERPFFVGSVKTNIGHLEAAAGIAGLIKVLLALKHRVIPRHLHFESLNPEIDQTSGAFVVPTSETPWEAIDGTRIAGVSSFGFSGTNAHAIIESFESDESIEHEPAHMPTFTLIPISTRTEASLNELTRRHADMIDALPASLLASYAHTAGACRTHFSHRLAVVASTPAEAVMSLRAAAAGATTERVMRSVRTRDKAPRIGFLFTGQGALYESMGLQLYEQEEVFRSAIERCSKVAQAELGKNLREILFGSEQQLLTQTAYAQPACLALQYGLVAQWRAWGIQPEAVLGHSLGEFAACVAAGALTLDDAMRLVIQRARLMGALVNAGAAASVPLEAARLRQFLDECSTSVGIAAYNTPESNLISGDARMLQTLVQTLNAQGIQAKMMPGLIGVHSATMDAILDDLYQASSHLSVRSSHIPIISGMEGREVSGQEVADPLYWRRHARLPVRFVDGMRTLLARGIDTFIEIGPRHTLLRLGQACAEENEPLSWLPSLSKERHDRQQMLESAAELYVRGASLDWSALYATSPSRIVSVPHYPFARDRHWIKRRSSPRSDGEATVATLLGKRVRSPLPYLQFETTLSDESPSTLTGHKLFGESIVPAAALVSRLMAASLVLGWAALEIRDLIFVRPLVVKKDAEVFSQLVLKPEGTDFEFEIMSRTASDDSAPWLRHTAGTLRQLGTQPELPRGVSLQLEAAEPGDVFYEKHAARGYDLSAEFRWVEQFWAGLTDCTATLRPLPAADRGTLPPGLLDSCLQLATRLDSERPLEEGELFMPMSIDALHIRPISPGQRIICTATMTSRGDHGDVVANLMAHTDDAVVIEIEGLRLRRVRSDKVSSILPRKSPACSYDLEWSIRSANAAVVPQNTESGWIVFSQGDECGRAVVRELRDLGETVVVVSPGERFETRGDSYSVAPNSAADFDALLADAMMQLGGCRGVIHMWGGSPTWDWQRVDAEKALRESQTAVSSLIHLTGALAKRTRPPRVWVVTQGAQRVNQTDDASCLAAASLWGSGRTIARELPEIWGGLIDVDANRAPEMAQRVVEEVWSSASGLEVAHRAAGRFVPSLVSRSLGGEPPRLTPTATYLVSGGLGSLGLRVARWLVGLGARRLVLIGRGLSIVPEEPLRSLRSTGVGVRVAHIDVTNLEQVVELIAEINASGFPLRGVVHAAGVLDDAPALEMTPARVASVMAPKIAGALTLHQGVSQNPLDFFVLFSSIFGILGNEGQVAYAAANSFLYRFAEERTLVGHPTLAVSWGPWQGAGMAEHQFEQLHRRWGLIGLEHSEAFTHLNHSLGGGISHTAVLALDPAQVAKRAGGTLLSTTVGRAVPTAATLAPIDPVSEVFAAPLQARRERLAAHVRATLSGVLGTSSQIEWRDDQRFEELGMDSLLAIDLSRSLQSSLKTTIPPKVVLEHPTLGGLVEYLSEVLCVKLDAPRTAARTPEQMYAG